MLRLLAAAGALVLAIAPAQASRLSIDPMCAGPRFEAATGESRTAAALLRAFETRELGDRGRLWLGKLASVGGGARDTLVWASDALDAARPIDVVVYFEGHGSFADDAMDHRHAAAIERLAASGGNVAYAAPDAPSSAHGVARAKTSYWRAGCATQRCAGGHAAPGDFVGFVRDLRVRLAAMTCVAPSAIALRLHLVGFSNGGKGVAEALAQLAAVDFVVDERRLAVVDVIFADGNYGGWLDDAWRAAAAVAPRFVVLVREGGADGNRRRAAAFGRAVPTALVVTLPLSHHGVGDAAIDHVQVE